MHIKRLALVFVVVASAAAARGDDEPPARWPNLPARVLGPEDTKIVILSPRDTTDVDGEMVAAEFDLRKPGSLPELREAILRLRALGQLQLASEDAHPERTRPFTHDVSSDGKRRALGETLILLDQRIAAGGAVDPARMLHTLELLHAVQNSFRYPVPRYYQLIPDIFPRLLLQLRRHQSVEVAPAVVAIPDPPPSSFWRNPGDIRSADLYTGFRRPMLPRYGDAICEYKGPKTGWGAHPGFDMECGGLKLRFNLGDERYGGPFNTRLFDVLGYHIEPVDPMPRLRLRYDRRVLAEYNSRKLLTMQLKFLFVPLKTHTITDIEDPFARIDSAVLRDGRRVDGAELKRRLLRHHAVVPGQPRPETLPENYEPVFERKIDYLVWQAGTVEPEVENLQSIGAWDYDQLEHAARREVRALFVLAAWVDQFNLRWENTRLAYLKEGDEWSLVHVLSDVGSGLGLARNLRRSFNSVVDSMLWQVTERDGDGTVRFSGFASSMENQAFSSLDGDDARWILRRMALLGERQILAGLLATGMSAAEVRLALEKLLSRRRKMLEDFGLAGEFPEITSRRIDRQLSFDPTKGDQLARVSLDTPNGRVVPALGIWRVSRGRLERAR